jgi:8-oxo-dGTP diphosphatase
MSDRIDKVAWVCLNSGRVLCARSRGKERFYLPGGKREPGETDEQTLCREVAEEVSVRIVPDSLSPLGSFEATADAKETGVAVRMSCYLAAYEGVLAPAAEIEELAWLGAADRHRVSAACARVLDRLRVDGLIE